jgi:hypothetical protein
MFFYRRSAMTAWLHLLLISNIRYLIALNEAEGLPAPAVGMHALVICPNGYGYRARVTLR